ncbi:MAG: DUF1801 domain-containing protein [Lapillicoccus sp.]
MSDARQWVLAHAFTLQVAAYIVRPTSAYKALEMDVSPGLIGLIAASFAVVPLVLAVPIGRWNDSRPPFPAMALGALCMLLGGLGLVVWAASLGALLLWNAIIGLGHLMSVLGEQTVVARRGGEALDSAFGKYADNGRRGWDHEAVGARNPAVDAWFEAYDNPQADLVQRVRTVILDASPEVAEVIKWQAPTFVYQGNIASFYPKSKQHVSLMFHQGASLPDPTGLLEGAGDTSRVAKFANAEDLTAKAGALADLVRTWVAARS